MKNTPKTTQKTAPDGGFFIALEKIRANELSNSDLAMISGGYNRDFGVKKLGFEPDLGYVFQQIPRKKNERSKQR